MQCPACQVDLVMSERQGIEIDYCPKCRGVWLDRGELDKIIERSGGPGFGAPPQQQQGRYDDDDDDDDRRRYPPNDPYWQQRREQYPKKRKGFFGELFDFD